MIRGLENVSVLTHISMLFLTTIMSIFAFGNPFFLLTISLPYLIFYMIDRSPGNGEVMRFRFNWWKNLPIWKYYCRYFQLKIEKTKHLESTFDSTNSGKLNGSNPITYIFGYHPHGIAALASFGLTNNGCDFDTKFPGIKMSLLTLTNNFQLPFYREYLLLSGLSSVSKKNILKLLENYISVCLVPGGAKESLAIDFSGNKINLVLKNRKGFVKIAITNTKNGRRTALVPIFSFGENELYKVVKAKEGSFLKNLQLWLKNNIGFTIPIFFGRGIWNADFGLMPYREKVTMVFGNPIEINLDNFEESSEETVVNHFHHLYIEELLKIFNENKDKYGYQNKVINFVD
ncbi:hypothetical protein QEN19_001512 [Hanseniaspora menglaensis]